MARHATIGGDGIAAFEIWASPEATVARLGPRRFRDQIVETGHDRRIGDIDRLASLGVAATRYPVLWERCAPGDSAQVDLRWAKERLERLRALGVEPIVTLLHHGGGPRYTSLVDPGFARGFANFAARVATAFPWVRRWTPINEPLTTARFSTLYGHRYPCGVEDHEAFGRAMINQVRAIAMAMDAIRERQPEAQLVLTEDLQTFDAADAGALPYAEHKRERSFLSAELLMGRIVEGHPMHRYLIERCRVHASTLAQLAASPAPPDLIAWNYYPYSQRHLQSEPGGAVANRGLIEIAPERLSPRAALHAAYERLRVPMALGEVHRDGDDRTRLAWLVDRVDDACALAAQGVPIRAIGLWAAFGMVDWQSLLLRHHGASEDGIFRFAGAGEPAPTLLVDAVRALVRADYDAMRALLASSSNFTSAEATA